MLGWEWDARVDNGAAPPGLVTLAASPGTGDILQDAGGVYAPGSAISHMVKYQAPSGALVVTTGTNHWAWGLADDARGDGEPDRRIQQATTNILMDMGSVPETPVSNIVLDDPTAPPLVTQRTPASGATDVDPASLVRALFSRPMDASTINTTSVRLERPGGSAVAGAVAYDATTFAITFTPGFALDLNTTYTLRLAATIRAANGVTLGTPQSWSFTTRPPDTTPPAVAVTSPADGSTVVASGTLTANATDSGGVAGVRFKVDGNDVGAEDTVAPYTMPWNVPAMSAGLHTVTAVARDTSNNSATSAPVSVTVDPKGLVAAYGFEETSGTAAGDASGKGNAGTISGATRTTSGRFGRALSFDGVNDIVNVPDSSTLDLTNAVTLEAWVNPSVAGGWRTALMKEQPAGLVYGMYSNTDSNRPSAHVYTNTEFDIRGTAAAPVNTWTHLAATYDGTTLRLYVNGTQVSTRTLTGNVITSTGALRIGGNTIWGEYFQGSIDEVRLYRRVLSATEVQTDMNTSVVSPDTQPPTAPTNLAATGSIGQVALTWTAATDDVGVARYNVHRSPTPGFTPTTANRVAQVTGTSHADAVAAGTWYYRVVAEDGATNPSPSSNEATATATSDTTPPTVSMTAPSAGATLVGNVNVTANAADNVGVAGVRFRLDNTDLGAEDTSAPYSVSWDTRTAGNGPHTLTAIARDAAGGQTTATAVAVTVDNPPVDTSGLVAAYGFEEPSGDAVTDASTQANAGTLTGATRTAAGRFGSALSFDGAGDWVTTPDANSLDLTTAMTLEAWVNPSAITGWRTAVLKEGTGGLSYGLYANSSSNRPSANVHIGSSELDTRGTAQLALNTWSHLAATYDGANLRLYVNGTLVATRPTTGALALGSGPLRIGGNSFAGDEFFTGLIDEVRVYQRVLTAGEIQVDMGSAIVSADASPPTAPTGLTATGGIGSATLGWTAASDDVGVVRYNVHRSATSGFTPTVANRVAQVTTGTSHVDTGVAPGTWFYKVTAQDAAGNVGPASAQASATATADTTAPSVSLTAPAAGATVVGPVHLTANATDNVAVAGVQFKVDGANVGAEDTTAPYDVTWDTTAATNTTHTITAVARDGSGNQTTSAGRTVTVNNPPVDTTGLVAAFGFEEGTGAAVNDASIANNDGSITGASWSPAGRFGSALSFDGVDDRINVADSSSLDLTNGMTLEAWVHPDQNAGWRTVVMKEAGGDLAYSMYSSAWSDRPSGHVFTGGERDTRAPASLPVGTWSHLAVTFDGTTLRLYVDGTQVSSTAVGGTVLTSTGALRIGGNAIWGEYFKGMIDEVRVYSRALTATEIQRDRDAAVTAGSQPGAGPEVTGQFSAPVTWPLVPVHIATLSNGKIAVWDGFDAALNSERIWDPATGGFDPIPTGRNLFCAAHITLPDGRLFVAGGHIEANVGLKDTHIYNPTSDTWFRGTDMARGRWYPTATTLPDGRILVVSGDNITLNAPGMPTPLKNGSETLPEIYNVDTNTWTPLPAGQRRMPLYPFMFLLPDGRVVDAGPDLQTRTLNTTTGQWTNVTTSQVDGHSAVMYRPGKILKSGTWADVDYPGIPASNRAQTIDFNQGSPTWQDTAPMHQGRSYHTLTALPDGTVLASGGGSESDGVDHSKAVFPVEIWNPDTGQWTEGASHQRARLYHSSALLMQDGRVLLAGGGAFGTAINESNAEIYSPPYLFKGPRPSITGAPAQINLGQSFTVNTPDAANVEQMSLVRMGSVTHNFDMDQRFQYLPMTQTGTGTVSVDAPSNINVAPPGWYYLFAVSDEGVPSVGRIIQIRQPTGRHPGAGSARQPHGHGPERDGRAAQLDRRDRQRGDRRVPRPPLLYHRLHALGGQPDRHRVRLDADLHRPGPAGRDVVLPGGRGRRGRQRRHLLARGGRDDRARHDAADRVRHRAGRLGDRLRGHRLADRDRRGQPRGGLRPVQDRRQQRRQRRHELALLADLGQPYGRRRAAHGDRRGDRHGDAADHVGVRGDHGQQRARTRYAGADGPERADGGRHDEFGPAQLDRRERQRGRGPLQRAPEHGGRVHAVHRQPDRPADEHVVPRSGTRRRRLLLPRDRAGRGRQRRSADGRGQGHGRRDSAHGLGDRPGRRLDRVRHGLRHRDRDRRGRRGRRDVPDRRDRTRGRGHEQPVQRVVEHGDGVQREPYGDRGGARRRRQQHDVGAGDGHRVQHRAQPHRPRDGTRLRRSLGDRGDRQLGLGQRRHDLRRHALGDGQIRRRPHVRRRQRHRDGRGFWLARPDHRHDARGVGPAVGARRLADRDTQGAPGRAGLCALQQRGRQPAERPLVHRGQRVRHARHGAGRGQRVDAHRRHVRRPQPAALRQRDAGVQPRPERRDAGVHRRPADRRQPDLARVVLRHDRRSARLQPRPVRGRSDRGHEPSRHRRLSRRRDGAARYCQVQRIVRDGRPETLPAASTARTESAGVVEQSVIPVTV